MPSQSASWHSSSRGAGTAAELRPLHSRLVEVLRGEQEVLGTGLGEHLEPAPPGGRDFVGGFFRGDVDDVEGRVHEFGQLDGASGGFALGELRVAGGVELRGLVAFSDEALREPADHVVVLGVDHGQRAHAPRRFQHVEELAVIQTHQVVGHVDLEGNDSLVHELRNLRLERLRRGVGDDQVEPVVGNRLRSRGLVVGGHHFPRRRSPSLHREGEHRRGPPADRRDRPRVVVVGAHQSHRGLLLDVGVRVHPAGNDQPALRRELFLSRAESQRDGPHHPPRNPDVRGPDAVGGHHGPAAHHGFEIRHRKGAILS